MAKSFERLLLSALLFASANCFCSSAEAISRSDDELLLVELSLGQSNLSEDFPIYPLGKGAMLPLAEFSRLLGLALTVDSEAGKAEGYVLSEDRKFLLNVRLGHAVVNGKVLPFDPILIDLQSDDIYVDSSLLEAWFPLELKIDSFSARIRVYTKELFPLEQRLKREQFSPGSASPTQSDADYERLAEPRKLWSMPFVDSSFTFSLNRSPSSLLTDTQSSTFITGDLLAMDGKLFMRGSPLRPLSDMRLSLGSKDPDGALLGSFGARSFSFGSLDAPGLPLISSAHQATGLAFDNYPLAQQNQFDSHDFRGDLPPGWDVEIYQNDVLMGHQQSGEDGRYRFDNLPLLMGLNEFRLVFYGPQGQRRQEIQRFNIENSLTKPKEMHYRFAGGLDDHGKSRSMMQCDFGLSKQLSGTLGCTDLAIAGKSAKYAEFGLRGFLNEHFLHLDTAVSTMGGSIAEAGLRSKFGFLDIDLRHARANNFFSELFLEHSDPMLRQTQLQLNASRFLSAIPFFSTGFTASSNQSQSGREATQIGNRISISHDSLSLTNRLDRNFSSGLDNALFSAGSLQLSFRKIGFGLNGDLSYTPRGPELLNVTSELPPIQGGQLSLGANYSLQSQSASFNSSFNRDLGTYLLGLYANYQGQGAFAVGTTLSFSLAPEPAKGRWHVASQPVAESGAVSVRVFLDANQNDRFDKGETLLEGVEVEASGAMGIKTDKNGIAYFSKVEPYQPVDIVLSSETLDDPLWVPKYLGLQLLPRPGKIAEVDYPILMTSELSGTAYKRDKDGVDKASGVSVELIDAQGKTVQKTHSAYDGFFTLTSIPPGKYSVKIGQEQQKRFSLVFPHLQNAGISSGITYDQVNLLVEPPDFKKSLEIDEHVPPATEIFVPLPAKKNSPIGLFQDRENHNIDPSPGKDKSLLGPSQSKKTGLKDETIRLTSEISGMAYLREKGKLKKLPGIVLELFDALGPNCFIARSAKDGSFVLKAIPPGRYGLRIARDQQKRYNLIIPNLKGVAVMGGTHYDRVNLLLEPVK